MFTSLKPLITRCDLGIGAKIFVTYDPGGGYNEGWKMCF